MIRGESHSLLPLNNTNSTSNNSTNTDLRLSHMHTLTRTHTHIHTRSHTHTQLRIRSLWPLLHPRLSLHPLRRWQQCLVSARLRPGVLRVLRVPLFLVLLVVLVLSAVLAVLHENPVDRVDRALVLRAQQQLPVRQSTLTLPTHSRRPLRQRVAAARCTPTQTRTPFKRQ